MYEKAAELFEIPCLARPFITSFLKSGEITLLERLERRLYGEKELYSIIINAICEEPHAFIADAYSRAVLNKAEKDGKLFYEPANFYKRLAFFAQYEPDEWVKIPQTERRAIDEWYVEQYAKGAVGRLDAALAGEGLIENAFFCTLEETFEIIDSLKDDPYMVPCNCKSVALNCCGKKPIDVCIVFDKGVNSEWDRGHGTALSKEEAKKLVRRANKSGLMQTSETERAICNCCGDCCYPIRTSMKIGAQGVWPKKRYNVVWDEDKCVCCGKCAAICNFGAFSKDGGKIFFDAKKCWGCTICKNHCPTGAISLQKIAEGRTFSEALPRK